MAYKLLCVFPNSEDATSFYRGLGPLAELERSGEIDIITTKQFDWTTLIKCHALFMQRPYSPTHVAIIKFAKVMGMKVWVDYDDDLFSVPRDNPSYIIYEKPEIKESVKYCVDNADKITVSTKALLSLRKDAILVPNALNLKLFPFHEPNVKSNYILWRGGDSHQKDLLTYQDQITEASNETESVSVFIGYYPWFILERLQEKKGLYIKGLDIFDYHEVIAKKIKPKLLTVPLAFNKFNESKSNIAWLEATMAGALTVAPNTHEWMKPGIFNYTDEESFRYQMVKAFNCGSGPHEEKIKASREVIIQNYNLEKVNELRMQVIREIAR